MKDSRGLKNKQVNLKSLAIKYIAGPGPHEGHTIRVLGCDGLFPDDPERWLVECQKDGHRWGFKLDDSWDWLARCRVVENHGRTS